MLNKEELLKSFHKQVNAVAAKALDALEAEEALQVIHPMVMHRIRRKIFDIAWESYRVGYNAGKRVESDCIHNS